MNDVAVILLAAGKGTRMESENPKVLHEILGKPIVLWDLELIQVLMPKETIIVVGHKALLVKQVIKKHNFSPKIVNQSEQLGTAHSVSTALSKVSQGVKTILVLYGDDACLYKPKTIKDFVMSHKKNGHFATFLTTSMAKPNAVGSVYKDSYGNILGIYTLSQMLEKGITKNEVVCGAFCFNKRWLLKNIKKIVPNPRTGEYGLPSLIGIGVQQNEFVKTYLLKDSSEWNSINTSEELLQAEKKKIKYRENT